MVKPQKTVAAVLSALFGNSEKAVSEKLTQDEFNAFAADAQEVQNRLDAQAEGNAAMNADLTKANEAADAAELTLATTQAALVTAQTDLATAQTLAGKLKAKADQWDAYKASLTGTTVAEDSTNSGPAIETGLSAKDQSDLDSLKALKAKHPTLMAHVELPE